MSENQKAGWSFCRKDAMIIAHSPVLSFKLSRKKYNNCISDRGVSGLPPLCGKTAASEIPLFLFQADAGRMLKTCRMGEAEGVLHGLSEI
jgi:hypothetical protein